MRGPPSPSEAPALAAGEGRAAGAEPAAAEPWRPGPSSPPSLGAIFWVFLLVGATSFGGGASAHVHDAVVVRKKWLDEGRFLEALTVGRGLPGTNVSNLAAFVGAMLAGTRGAIVAFVGVVAPGAVAVLLVASAYVSLAGASAGPAFKGAFQGLAAGAVGVMASTVAQTAKTAVRARGGLVIAAGAFVAVALFRVSLLLVLVALVPLASALSRAKGR
ncbi:MAG TPA: chromate transporter [Polyangiaceae bacterium]|nr:chromate transporter [Polyangiaceae bacterium]